MTKSKLTFNGYQAAILKEKSFENPYYPYFHLVSSVGDFNNLVGELIDNQLSEVDDQIIRDSVLDRLGCILKDLSDICSILDADLSEIAEHSLDKEIVN